MDRAVAITLCAAVAVTANAFTPATGYRTVDLDLFGSAIAVSPSGKLAVGEDAFGGGALIRVFDSVLPGRNLLYTITAPSGHNWQFLSALTWQDDETLIIAENGDMDTAYSAVGPTVTPLAPIGSIPSIAGLTLGFGGDLFATAATDPGTGTVYRLHSGTVTAFAGSFGTGYLGGIAFLDDVLYVADTNDPFFLGNPGQVHRFASDGSYLGAISLADGGGSGVVDILFDTEGDLIATTGSTLTVNSVTLGTFSGPWPFPTSLAYTGSGFEPFSGTGLLLVNGTFTEMGGIFGITPVPEPGAIALLLPALALIRRRR
ncbi:MAG: hypothetical protein AMXMBFR61_12370 [Fimbriimonadales bacterium]